MCVACPPIGACPAFRSHSALIAQSFWFYVFFLLLPERVNSIFFRICCLRSDTMAKDIVWYRILRSSGSKSQNVEYFSRKTCRIAYIYRFVIRILGETEVGVARKILIIC